MDDEHKNINYKIIQLKNAYENNFRECNRHIQLKNQYNIDKGKLNDNITKNKTELSKVNLLMNRLNDIANSYEEYFENNENKHNELNKKIINQWNNIECNLFNWTNNDLFYWLKYKFNTYIIDNNINVDWNTIKQKIKHINGKNLKEIMNGSKRPIFFNDYGLERKTIYYLNKLMTYLCPLSGKIMMDPVEAYDGIIYDRKSIQKYFTDNKNNKILLSPINNKKILRKTLIKKYELKNKIKKYIDTNNMMCVSCVSCVINCSFTVDFNIPL